MYRSNWLSFEEWKDQGMPILGTTSTEAVKLYDAALTQYVGWYDDPVMGGIAHTMAKLEQADPNFILGKAFTLSMKLFGFSENYFYNQDLKMEVDGSTHALAHTYLMQKRYGEGQNFMKDTCKLWTTANLLACHNYWHFALFHLSDDKADEAVYLLDNEILPRFRSTQTPISITNASSLLFRLFLMEPDKCPLSKDQMATTFNEIFSVSKQYLNRHILPFADIHYMMTCIGSGHTVEAADLVETFKTSPYATTHPEMLPILVDFMSSMLYYHEGNFTKATDMLLSIKNSLHLIGGSVAQQDIFNQMLIASATKSSNPSHHKISQDHQL